MPPPRNASREIAEVILKACSYYSKDRYQNATEFKKDLLKLLERTKDTKPLMETNAAKIDESEFVDLHNKTESIFSRIEEKENERIQTDEFEAQNKETYKNIYNSNQSEENITNNINKKEESKYIPNQKIESNTNSVNKDKKKSLIPAIISIIVVILIIVSNNSSKEKIDNNTTTENNTLSDISTNIDNDENKTDSGKITFSSTMKNSTMGNLYYEFPDNFHLGNSSGYVYYYKNIDYWIELRSFAVGASLGTEEAVIESEKRTYCGLNGEYGDIKKVNINGNNWTTIELTRFYKNLKIKDIYDVYVIKVNEIIYEVKFSARGISKEESNDKYIANFEKTKNSLKFIDAPSRNKVVGELKYTVPDDLEERGITYADKLLFQGSAHVSYSFAIEMSDKDKINDYIKQLENLESLEEYEKCETKNINGNNWVTIKGRKETNLDPFYIVEETIYYVVEKNGKQYKFKFLASITYNDENREEQIDEAYFETMINSIINSVEFR